MYIYLSLLVSIRVRAYKYTLKKWSSAWHITFLKEKLTELVMRTILAHKLRLKDESESY